MRDLVFKNLTSRDKKRKVFASSETMDKAGVRSIIQRHFIYLAKEIPDTKVPKPLPQLYVTREHNSFQQSEKFFCKLKGSVYVVCENKIYLIIYLHSLSITLTPAQHPVIS
jgi:hypothetical protein